MWGTPLRSGSTAKEYLQQSTEAVLVQVHHTSVSTSGESIPAVFWRASPSNIRIPKVAHTAFSSMQGNCYQSILVVSGFGHVFTKYCQDKFLLGLQAIAQENKLGPIWCCASREFIFGCTSENNTNLLLKHFTSETISHLARAGFPFKSSNAFLPNFQMEPQFGMYIDILWEMFWMRDVLFYSFEKSLLLFSCC